MKRAGLARPCARVAIAALITLLSGCATSTETPAANDPATTIDVVERDWHTDVCIRTEDADTHLMRLVVGYEGSRYLCFGFGDRHYLLSRERGPMTLLSALLPGAGAILLTVLRDTPAAAFGTDNVVRLDVGEPGMERLREFLGNAVQTDDAGAPISLGEGPIQAASTSAPRLTMTASIRAIPGPPTPCARPIPILGPVLFADGVMRQVRQIAQPAR
jgi:hypothetical protein